MLDFLSGLFDRDFVPHAYCLRSPWLIDLHAGSDAVIAVSYFLIPFAAWQFLKNRPDLSFRWLYFLFAAFVLSCGLTHALSVWTLWHPFYWLEALVKLITAAISLPAAILFLSAVPKAISAPNPQTLLAAIVEASEDAIISKDLQGTITSWNAGAERIYGYSASEAVGQSISILTVPDRIDEIPEILARVASGSSVDHYETRRLRKDGVIIDVSLAVSPIRDSRGKVTGASVISRDITERKRVEEQFRTQATLLDQSHDAIIVRTLDGVISYWSRGAEKLYGFWRNDAVGQISHKLLRTVHPLGIRHFSEALVRDGRWTGELTHFTRDGRKITVESDQIVVEDESSDRTLVLETNRDITERKAVEQSVAQLNMQIRDSEERFRTLAEAVPVLLWSSGPDGRTEYTSSRFFQYAGISPEGDLDKAWHKAMHPDDMERVVAAREVSVQTGEPYRAEFRLRKRDGAYRWFVGQAIPVRNADGSIRQWLGSCSDVDDLKRIEAALVRSNSELRQFAYAAAHDLQEPLRNVALSLSMLQLSNHHALDPEAEEWMNSSIEGARRMQLMIKDLLDYSRVVDSEVRPGLAADSDKALTLALANLKASIDESGAFIRHDLLPQVRAEEVHIARIFQNLISNSIKYRWPDVKPEVTISAKRQNGDWVFSVGDNGIGFDPVYAEQIFGVFKRLHTRAEFPGNGIGLSVCARIVAHYGGRIWAEAEPNRGATFRFTLPATEEVNG